MPMAVRCTTSGVRSVRFEHEGQPVQGEIVVLSGVSAFVRAKVAPGIGESLELRWPGAGRVRLQTRVRTVSLEGADGRYGIGLALLRVDSEEGQEAVTRFVRCQLGLELGRRSRAVGRWWLALTEDAPLPVGAALSSSARPKVAGVRVSQEKSPPLDTGLPATTPDRLQEFFEKGPRSRVGVYLNVPCAYFVAGAQYWGRALRMNDRWLQVNTNSVVPGLGVRLRCDLTLEIDGVPRAVSVKGVNARKLDPPAGSTWKGTLGVRITDVDEGESPGLLLHYIQVHEARRQERDRK